MIMGIAGFVVMFIPYVSALTIALWPAAIITGIIAISRAKKFDNRKGSGFASGLAGLLTGGLGLAAVIFGGISDFGALAIVIASPILNSLLRP